MNDANFLNKKSISIEEKIIKKRVNVTRSLDNTNDLNDPNNLMEKMQNSKNLISKKDENIKRFHKCKKPIINNNLNNHNHYLIISLNLLEQVEILNSQESLFF